MRALHRRAIPKYLRPPDETLWVMTPTSLKAQITPPKQVTTQHRVRVTGKDTGLRTASI